MNQTKIIFNFLLIFLVFSCDNIVKESNNSPISGSIKIFVDETYKPIIEQEIQVFESQYPQANINAIYLPAIDCLNEYLKDSTKMIISSIVPSKNLQSQFEKKYKFPSKIIPIAKDAIAIIVNKEKGSIKLKNSDLKDILKGNIKTFSQINSSLSSQEINIIFDNNNSSTLQYLNDSILKGEKIITKNVFSQTNNLEVLDYVSKNENAIGIIGVSWISDEADEKFQNFSKKVELVEIGDSSNTYYYKPLLGYIAIHKYPLRRILNITLNENGSGLGKGFTNFITSDIGQKIILKAGIVPSAVLTRVVETK